MNPHGRGVRTRWSLRSILPQPILWFCKGWYIWSKTQLWLRTADTPGNSFMSSSKEISKKKTSHPHVAVSISRKGLSFSFWPEAEEQLIHDVFHGDSHSGLPQVTSQKDLVPVLASVPGTIQAPSVKELSRHQQGKAGAEFGISHTGGWVLQPDFMPPPYKDRKAFHLSSLLFFSWKYLVSVEGLNSGCNIAISNLHFCCSDPQFWFGIVPIQKKWL